MLNQLVELLKGVFIQKEVDAFARSHLAGSVLFVDASSSAAGLSLLLAFVQLIELRCFRRLLFL